MNINCVFNYIFKKVEWIFKFTCLLKVSIKTYLSGIVTPILCPTDISLEPDSLYSTHWDHSNLRDTESKEKTFYLNYHKCLNNPPNLLNHMYFVNLEHVIRPKVLRYH